LDALDIDFSEVPTPWMCLQHDLREAGVYPAIITRISDRTMPDNYAALRAGQLDVMQALEPLASQAEIDRAGDQQYELSFPRCGRVSTGCHPPREPANKTPGSPERRTGGNRAH
jgi:hypothetical protein